MLISHHDILMNQEHTRELLRQAGEERLLRQLRAARNQGDGLHGRALIWLGRRLVAWGEGLQERYGAPAVAS
ncbi:MAG: hypothetical protein Kow0063_06330 [Anaerolineae bacterium]